MGIDIIEIPRIRAAVERFGDRFLNRIFTGAERAYAEASPHLQWERLAGRFAAKEAAMKALGTGWGRGVRWTDVEVRGGRGQKPTIVLHGVARREARRLGAGAVHCALSHARDYAVATVVITSAHPPRLGGERP